MGREMVSLLDESKTCELAVALASENNLNVGEKMSALFCECRSNVILTNDVPAMLQNVDVIVDVTCAEAIKKNIVHYNS